MSARHILKVNASARTQGSATRALVDDVVTKLAGSEAVVTERDLGRNPPPIVTEAWVGANFTADDQRSDAQKAELAVSDALIAELKAADTIVIGAPVYNFGVPTALKAWIDQVARARVTFRYTPEGPVGLLEGKRAVVVIASGGTPVGSEIDFASGYLRHVLGFLGITDVTVISADQQMRDAEAAAAKAQAQLAALAA
ncbi:MAG: FMN-dependent NADH-azoreductase [Maricaulaceae bacterium]